MAHVSRSHEIPTHLNVEDRIVFGLTARQALHLMSGLSGAYGLWTQWPDWPLPVRTALALASVLGALLFAFWQPRGRPLEEWAFAALRYVTIPRASTWRPRDPDPSAWLGNETHWEELATPVELGWVQDERDSRRTEEHRR